ncbi:hypothetical protein [Pseudomonas sp. NFIX28]|uniref:hypothetical protein n=1 Tax=Pseudomonas sp. NFIX28 TaxID=1566235 RepID=UPI0008970F25|nr:hypothetical protein [Pseudomonas sp. NFIX28]SDZ28675.1 hypothetical protein SAMN03159453_03021 [Pseudomonas sp. NFIX28]
MKTLNRNDLIELSQATGRSIYEVMQIAQQSGWNYSEATEPAKRLRGLDNAADAYTMMKQVKEQTLSNLYQNDPLIRESINAHSAIEQARTSQETSKPTNLIYDEHGNFKGLKKSVINGIHATGKHQTDAMKAIKADIYKRFGVDE